MDEKKTRRSVIVGLFVFIGIIFLVSGILVIGNLSGTFKRKVEIVSVFDDVGGLKDGNNIWFSGVKVGTVASMEFYDHSRVRVKMRIDRKAVPYIRKDSRVKLSSEGFIGNKILIIFDGSTRVPHVENGDTLVEEKTFSTDQMMEVLQANNNNLLTITTDFKNLTENLMNGKGTIGKLLSDESVYDHLNAATTSLENASNNAQQMISSLTQFSQGLNKKGTLANELTTDTTVFRTVKSSVSTLAHSVDSVSVIINNLKEASQNPETPMGVLLFDKESGGKIKEMIKNLDESSRKLSEDLEALQHSFLLRGYFRKKEKEKE